jgi:hypothetical protein
MGALAAGVRNGGQPDLPGGGRGAFSATANHRPPVRPTSRRCVWADPLAVGPSRYPERGQQIFVELDPDDVAGVLVMIVHPVAPPRLCLAQRRGVDRQRIFTAIVAAELAVRLACRTGLFPQSGRR